MSTFKILCFLGVIAAALATAEERIIGGQNAAVGQFPHQVALRTMRNQHFCGGAIISEWWVLSAAHCTMGDMEDPSMFVVVIGAHAINDGVPHLVAGVLNHPGFDMDGIQNDICLIAVQAPFEFSQRAHPIQLPSVDVPTSGNLQVTISGWGFIRVSTLRSTSTESIVNSSSTYRFQFNIANPNNAVLPTHLQFKNTRIIQHGECFQRLPPFLRSTLQWNKVCTINQRGQGICRGDSGGPLITNTNPRIVVGVASWVVPCGHGFPDVYARVFPHMQDFLLPVLQGKKFINGKKFVKGKLILEKQ